jgi:hypothetical protein
VASTFVSLACDPAAQKLDLGVIGLLQKASAHASVNISALALTALTQAIGRGFAQAHDLLPILQRRAIIPHQYSSSVQQSHLSLAVEETSGVNLHEFMRFRQVVLTDALLVCWTCDGRTYMDSCTSAIEEFCCQRPAPELSLQLEAALFCIEVAVVNALNLEPFPYSDQLKRCTIALSTKPETLTCNPLTTARMCSFICKVSNERNHVETLFSNTCFHPQFARWYANEDCLGVATDLVLSTFQNAMQNPSRPIQLEAEEVGVSEIGEASMALKELFSVGPNYFAMQENSRIVPGMFEPICLIDRLIDRLIVRLIVRLIDREMTLTYSISL